MQYKILISLLRNYVFFLLKSTPAFSGKNTCSYTIFTPGLMMYGTLIFAIAYQIFLTYKTAPRTSEDKFLKNKESLGQVVRKVDKSLSTG